MKRDLITNEILALARSGRLLDKRQLGEALGLASTRIIDGWVRSRRISSYRLGHRTLKFSLPQVLADLAKFEIKAIGRTGK